MTYAYGKYYPDCVILMECATCGYQLKQGNDNWAKGVCKFCGNFDGNFLILVKDETI